MSNRSSSNGFLVRSDMPALQAPASRAAHGETLPHVDLSDLFSASAEPASKPARLSFSLALPCYNESANIERTIRDVQAWFAADNIDGEIIVTDDGSTDASYELLVGLAKEMPNLKVVRHPINQGYGAAVRSGCDHGEKEWIGFMDSDGQFKAADFRLLLPLTSDFDFVTGVRTARADSLQRRLNSRMYNFLIRLLLGVHPSDLNCGMKIFRRSIWKTVRPVYATGAMVNAEIFYAMKNANIRWAETFVPHYPRLAGKPTGANLRVILRTFAELWRLKRWRNSLSATDYAAVSDDADAAVWLAK